MDPPIVLEYEHPVNMQDIHSGIDDLDDALQLSRQQWLDAVQWREIFRRPNRFRVINILSVPEETTGIYRADMGYTVDNNIWLKDIRSSAVKKRAQGLHFNVRIATGYRRFYINYEIVHDWEERGDLLLQRRVYRKKPLYGNLTFAHYRFVPVPV